MEKRELDKFIVEALTSTKEFTGRVRVKNEGLLKELRQMIIFKYG